MQQLLNKTLCAISILCVLVQAIVFKFMFILPEDFGIFAFIITLLFACVVPPIVLVLTTNTRMLQSRYAAIAGFFSYCSLLITAGFILFRINLI
jgi:hypothetical protein